MGHLNDGALASADVRPLQILLVRSMSWKVDQFERRALFYRPNAVAANGPPPWILSGGPESCPEPS